MTEIIQPKDAAAVILTRGADEICWAQRSLKLAFLGGFHAFAGGKVEKSDAETRVENCADKELSALIACAARECFEEIGILLTRGGEKMTVGQRASLHDDLLSGRMSFAEILAHWEIWLDAADFTFAGTWTTPPFSPVRFKTRFFHVVCPPKQTPFAASGELEKVEFIRAADGLARWTRGEILCAPPILNTLRVFSAVENQPARIENLLALAETEGAHPRKLELNSRVTIFPVKTLTLPPATHTNCFVVGRKQFVVIDAASPFPEEQGALAALIDEIIERGGVCRAIIVSHLHPDHTGGETALQTHLREKHRQHAPLAAHRLTAEKLPHIEFEKFFTDGDEFALQDADGNNFRLAVLHAPGHARGHLNFYDAEIGFLIACDNIIGAGSVLIAPPEGNMADYLDTLEQLKNLPNLQRLCGSHGAAMTNAAGRIEKYIAHRLEREGKILAAWQAGFETPAEIVERVYQDVKPELRKLAEKSILAHLEKLETEGKLTTDEHR